MWSAFTYFLVATPKHTHTPPKVRFVPTPFLYVSWYLIFKEFAHRWHSLDDKHRCCGRFLSLTVAHTQAASVTTTCVSHLHKDVQPWCWFSLCQGVVGVRFCVSWFVCVCVCSDGRHWLRSDARVVRKPAGSPVFSPSGRWHHHRRYNSLTFKQQKKYASADKRPSFSMFYLVGVDPRLSVKGHFPQGENRKNRVKALHPRGARHVAERRWQWKMG